MGFVLFGLLFLCFFKNLNPHHCLLLINISVPSACDLELAAQIFMQYTCVHLSVSSHTLVSLSLFSDLVIQFKLND